MRLSTAAWFYLFHAEVQADPRCDPRLSVHGLMVGATLHRLSTDGRLAFEVVTRRGGALWLARVPTLLVSRADDRYLRGSEARLLAELVARPRHGHDLFYRWERREERAGTTLLDAALDELEAAQLGVRDRLGHRPHVLIPDGRRAAAIHDEFVPLAEHWLSFCAEHPEAVEALVRDLRSAAHKDTGY